MKKYFVSEEKREKLIDLRKSGASWLKIENLINVPRRTAKRVFEEWQQSKSLEDIQSARREVAAETFRQHLQDLTTLARLISSRLGLPRIEDKRNGQEVIDGIYYEDIHVTEPNKSTFSSKKDYEIINRQNHLIFESLKQHTRGKVDWDLLDNWVKARNSWQDGIVILEEAARRQIRNALIRLPNGRLDANAKGALIPNEMIKGIVEAAYRALINGNTAEAASFIRIGERENGFVILFGDNSSPNNMLIETMEKAEKVKEVSIAALKMLFEADNSGLVNTLMVSLDTIREIHDKLVLKLDELVLTPVILKSKCDICPA